jgi:hypothetical protein
MASCQAASEPLALIFCAQLACSGWAVVTVKVGFAAAGGDLLLSSAAHEVLQTQKTITKVLDQLHTFHLTPSIA